MSAPDRRPVALPLHRQLRALILERIEAGDWAPGTYLPAETKLAEDYGVSVGTLRKALQDLAAEGVLVRRQGRGTVVASHEGDEALFRFLNLRRADGSRVRPESRVLARARRPASPEEAAGLGLAPGDPVVAIRRIREIDGTPAIFEEIAVAAARFPGLEARPELLPNTLYHLYQRSHAATVHQAEERLAAVTAGTEAAAALGVAPGAALLQVLRVAADYQGTPLERRLSLIRSDDLRYVCRL